MKYLFKFAGVILILLTACSMPLKDPCVFDISFDGRDTCFTKINADTTLLFFRKVEILENTINDTFLFGLSSVPGRFVGKIDYLQFEDRTDVLIYQDADARNMMPRTDRLCFRRYKPAKVVSGRIKIKVYTR